MVGAAAHFALVLNALFSKLLAGFWRTHYRRDRSRRFVGEHGPKPDDNVLDVPRREPALFVERRKCRAYVFVYVKATVLRVELDVRRFHGVLV